MGRRTVLLVVAAMIAALGTSLVFLYARGADTRAEAGQQPVEVLKAVKQINPGEKLSDAQAAGKIQLDSVPRAQVLDGAKDNTAGMDKLVALATIYPHEQIIAGKFGAAGGQSTLTIPDGDIAISVTLSDTGRVAGFVSPGAEVAIFLNSTPDGNGAATSRLLLPKVLVIAVGDTTVMSKTTTGKGGDQTVEQLPKTLFTLAVSQDEAEKVMYAVGHGELTVGLLNDRSRVRSGPGITNTNLFR